MLFHYYSQSEKRGGVMAARHKNFKGSSTYKVCEKHSSNQRRLPRQSVLATNPHIQSFRVKWGLSCVIGLLGRQGPAATLRQHCPQMTQYPVLGGLTEMTSTQLSRNLGPHPVECRLD